MNTVYAFFYVSFVLTKDYIMEDNLTWFCRKTQDTQSFLRRKENGNRQYGDKIEDCNGKTII